MTTGLCSQLAPQASEAVEKCNKGGWGTSLRPQAPWLAPELWQLLLLEGELKTFKK